jgi:hypothetical protein
MIPVISLKMDVVTERVDLPVDMSPALALPVEMSPAKAAEEIDKVKSNAQRSELKRFI